jgi:hypothetical protein
MKYLLIILLFASLASTAQIEKIKVTDLRRNITIKDTTLSGYIEVYAEFKIAVPPALSATPKARAIAKTYATMYNIISVDTIDGVLYALFTPPPLTLNIYKITNGVTTNEIITAATLRNALIAQYNEYETKFNAFVMLPFDNIIGKSWNGTTWINSSE